MNEPTPVSFYYMIFQSRIFVIPSFFQYCVILYFYYSILSLFFGELARRKDCRSGVHRRCDATRDWANQASREFRCPRWLSKLTCRYSRELRVESQPTDHTYTVQLDRRCCLYSFNVIETKCFWNYITYSSMSYSHLRLFMNIRD